MTTPRRAVYPGSFNPPTKAHLAIAELAIAQLRLTSVTFALSRVALAKESVERPVLDHRVSVVRQSVAHLNTAEVTVEVMVTDHQLLVDIADGFDVLIMGADKWEQIHDVVFYDGDPIRRDDAIARLPDVALVPRPPTHVGRPGAQLLNLDSPTEQMIDGVSSSLARDGNHEIMTPEAQAFDEATGAWTDPQRYEAYLAKLG